MTDYFETLRGEIQPPECDENGLMTTAALTARVADATAHALCAFGLGPRRLRQSRDRVRLIDERISRQFSLRSSDVFHIESALVSSDNENHIFDHRLILSESGAVSCIARTEITAPPLAYSTPRELPDQGGEVTWRGRVNAAECDQMRHMNVQFYMQKNSQSLARIGALLGLASNFFPATERILFERELYAGDVLVMRSGIRKIDGEQLHIASLMLNAETGAVAARFETVARLWHIVEGGTLALTGPVRDKAETFAVATDDAFPPPRPLSGPRLAEELPANTVVTCRRAVNSWEVGNSGVATPAFVISCVSDAAMHFFTHMGADLAWRMEHDIGSAALDYHICYHRPMAVGTPVEAHSRFLETREKTFRFSHHLSDATSGETTATVEVTAVLFDLNKRKSIPLPEEFREKARSFGSQERETRLR